LREQTDGTQYRTFLCQCPPTLIAIGLVEWKLRVPPSKFVKEEDARAKLNRIDWVGAVSLGLAILCPLLVIDLGGQKYAFSDPFIISTAVMAVVSGAIFLIQEKYFAKEPIFPLHLLTHYTVVTSYAILFLQTFSQTAVS
jgi:hypothetical protein